MFEAEAEAKILASVWPRYRCLIISSIIQYYVLKQFTYVGDDNFGLGLT